MTHNFTESLIWSKGQAYADDVLTLRKMIAGCISVEESSGILDKSGVDYVATLRRGAQILIDAKNRRKGCARYWRQGCPELALEFWSVRPDGKYRMPRAKSKTGWTLCESKQVDLILFKFDPSDCRDVFLVSYQLLRMAFVANHAQWRGVYKNDIQDNGNFESEAVFVPAACVLDAIRECSRGRLLISPPQSA